MDNHKSFPISKNKNPYNLDIILLVANAVKVLNLTRISFIMSPWQPLPVPNTTQSCTIMG